MVDFWQGKGHKVLAFLPQYFMRNRNPERLADDIPLLNSLIEEKVLILTPPQDYDDSYIIDVRIALIVMSNVSSVRTEA